MFARFGLLSLALAALSNQSAALDLDVNNKDSITSAAKSLASGIVAGYKNDLKETLTPGLLPSPTFSFWEAANVFTDLIEYGYLTGDLQYNDLIVEGMQHQLGDYDAFMPANQTKYLGNDDQSYWGLASLTAHEAGLPKPAKGGDWLDYAMNVWNTQVNRWDEKACSGGLRWQIFTFNNGYNYRNSITNGNFFVLSSRLAYLTGNSTYSDWATKSYNWSKAVGLIGANFQVYDGTDDKTDCSSVNNIQWSNNLGLYIEGSALMYNLTNGSTTWEQATRGHVNASSIFVSKKVLTEISCEHSGQCNLDQRAFKSGTIRSFARAAIVAPFVSSTLHAVIEGSAKAAAKNCEGDGEGVACSHNWNSPPNGQGSAKERYYGEVANALSAVKALLWADAKPILPGSATGGSSVSGNSTGTTSASLPENTSAAGSIKTSGACALVIAFAAALII